MDNDLLDWIYKQYGREVYDMVLDRNITDIDKLNQLLCDLYCVDSIHYPVQDTRYYR